MSLTNMLSVLHCSRRASESEYSFQLELLYLLKCLSVCWLKLLKHISLKLFNYDKETLEDLLYLFFVV
jgi:hypothetical protein